MPDGRLGRIFGEPPLNGAIKKAEDPFPNIFVEEIPFTGGPHLAFPGPNSGTSFEFQRLAESIFHNEEEWPADFVANTYQAVRAVLALSDLLAKRAGLKRGSPGDSTEKGEVVIPGSQEFDALRHAVTFSDAEFTSLLRKIGVDAEPLNDLIANQGSLELLNHAVSNGTLVHKPIIRSKNDLIIAAPQRLLAAVNQLILRQIVNLKLEDVFIRLYSKSTIRNVHTSLIRLRHLPIPFMPQCPPQIRGVYELFYLFDTDKILYVLLVCDALEAFDPRTIEGIWGTPELGKSLIERSRIVWDEISNKAPGAYELFCLLVPCGVNRIHELVINGWSDDLLALGMSPDNLETISLVEAGDKLALWRFARKSAQAGKRARFIVFDELDLFAAYRDTNYSFILGPPESPPSILVKPGYGRKLKTKIANEQDWHPVRSFQPKFVVNVNTLYGTKSVPIYGMPESQIPCACVEGLPCLVWVYPSHDVKESEESLYLDFICTVAYWTWQLSTFFKATMGTELHRLEMLHIQLSISPSVLTSRWTNEVPDPGVSATAPNRGTVLISFSDSFGIFTRRTDNEAERNLLRVLIPAVVEACGGSVPIFASSIESTVDKIAPLGLKRMLLHSDGAHVPQLDPRDLIPYRPIQAGETEDLIEELSEHVISTRDLKPGKLPATICNSILIDMVAVCFAQIAEVTKTLNPHGLLEFLIVLSESLIWESATQQLSLASRMKTFEHDREIIAKLPQEMTEFAESAIACRFIIEFVTAQPPMGQRRMSWAIYDRLQALAGRVITLGAISDSLYFRISDVEISVLPSHRLRIDNASYDAAAIMHLGGLAFSRIANAEDVFRHNLRERPQRVERSGEETEFDRATRAEFGYPLTELVTFLNAMGDIAVDLKPTTPAIMEKEALISSLSSELGWTRDKILGCLHLFSLTARDTYMSPPSGCRAEDLYPWRFNRATSYMRRPLLVRESNSKTEILWGHRHLDFARFYLIELCRSTRLKAKSLEMKSLLARFRHETGKRFNDAVRQHLEEVGGLIVRNRIEKVSHLRTGNLGDIDVLCADPNANVLWVIECKSLAMVRTPYEMRQELEALTVGDTKHPSIIKKHQLRTAWIEEHLIDVLGWLGIHNVAGWKVCPIIVVDTPSISPWLTRLPMAIISMDVFKARWPPLVATDSVSDQHFDGAQE